MAHVINYTPPPTVKKFIKDHRTGELFYDWIVGPVGSGKTSGNFFKLIYMAGLQQPGPDGIRRSRCVVVRNTAPQLKDTTIASWFTWFKDGQAGTWHETNKVFVLKFGDIECEVLFRPLDTAQDVARVLSLEVTFAILDEFVQIPRQIVDALSARCGRFPAKVDGGATNWGMWGASNTETEDNWWYTYLHDELPGNAKYFLQPSGYSEHAENLENLPGGRDYYVSAAEGKTKAWIKQFIEAEWGFSVAGKPVVTTFNPELHLSKSPIKYNPRLPLVGGFDPGITGTALIIGQNDPHDRLLVLGEVITQSVGATRFVTDFARPYIRRRFPEAELIIAPDPAAANRAQTDERSVVDILKKYFRVSIETNNRLAKRLDAYEHYTTRLTDVGPAFLIDAQECPVFVRAMKGGWRYVLNPSQEIKHPEPQKNMYSHPGDGGGYLARYFHKQTERSERSNGRRSAIVQPVPTYHFR